MKSRLARLVVALLVAAVVVTVAVLAAGFVLRAAPLPQAQSASAKSAADTRMNPADHALPPEILERHQHIQGLLAPFAKGELKSLVPEFRNRLSFQTSKPDPRTIAESEIHHTFPRATRPQLAVLTFDLIALSADKDALSDMSQEMQMKLQMTQQQYDACMQALSNILKATSNTKDSVISNIK